MAIAAEQRAMLVATLPVAILSPGPGVIAVSRAALALERRQAMPHTPLRARCASALRLAALPGLAVLLSIVPAAPAAADKRAIYATAARIELRFSAPLAALTALPPRRRGYYAAKSGTDRIAGPAIGLLGLSLILRHKGKNAP